MKINTKEFIDRVTEGIQIENHFENLCAQKSYKLIKIGQETLGDAAMAILRNMSDLGCEEAIYIRYSPDYLLFTPRPVYIEIKNSSTIEKHCYDQMLKLEKDGKNVRILFWKNNEFISCIPSKMRFYPGEINNKLDIPYDSLGFRYFDRLSIDKRKELKERYPKMSQTTCAYVAFDYFSCKKF